MQPDEDPFADAAAEVDDEPIAGLGEQPADPADDEPEGECL